MPVWCRVVLGLLAVGSLTLPMVPSAVGRDLLMSFVQLSCVAVCWVVVSRRRRLVRAGWGLLVLAVTVIAAGDLLQLLERHVLEVSGSADPSQMLLVLGYVLLGLGVLTLERQRSADGHASGSAEAAIFTVGALTPVLIFVVLPVLGHPAMAPGAKAVTVAYALADLLVLAVLARMVLTSEAGGRAFAFLGAALFAAFTGDLLSYWTTHGSPGTVSPAAQVLWLGAFVLFAAGVAHPSLVAFTFGDDRVHDAPRRRRVWLMAVGSAMPPLSLLAPVERWERLPLTVVAVGTLLVSLLVSARLSGLLDQISAQSGRLAAMARSDDLTGLHNRRSWNFELARACSFAAAERQLLTVALIDLDHFKQYNDSYGHPAGDRLLKAATAAWAGALLPGEVLARYGGEEFAMLLPGATLEDAVRRLDTIRKLTPGGQTFSAGVALWSPGADPEQAVADADSALYEAKRNGRDRVVAFRPPKPANNVDLPYALSTVVQPIVRSSDLAVVAYEALSRFEPAVDPEEIFGQAHEEGYGDVLEGTAILSALRLPDRPDGVEVFVNVSERAMRSPLFWRAMPPRLDGIVMELNEHRAGLDDTTVARMLDRFRDRGARICLDDLVATDSDLERIVTLRPDVVKLDRSLVTGCDSAPGQRDDLQRLLDFAAGYSVEVCAEGIETLEELAVLRSLEVPLLQGYLLGRPEGQWAEPLQPALLVAESERLVTRTTVR